MFSCGSPPALVKSVCYKVLPFVFDHKRGKVGSGEGSYSVVLVISPLVSLMVDQVTSLRERGVMAAIVSGHPGVSRFAGRAAYLFIAKHRLDEETVLSKFSESLLTFE